MNNLLKNLLFILAFVFVFILFGTTNVLANDTYTVKFDSNGGSLVDSQTIASGKTATAPASPTKPHYTFGGWYEDAEFTSAFDFSTSITENKTLYAKWIYNVLKMNVDGLGKIAYVEDGSELVYNEENLNQSSYTIIKGTYKIGAKADEGYKFVKWTKDGVDYSTNPEITVTLGEEDIDLRAVFKVIPSENLTFTVKNGAQISSYSELESIGVIYTLLQADKLVKENGSGDFESVQFYKDEDDKLVLMYEDKSRRFAYGEGYHDISYEITDEVRNAMQTDLDTHADLYDESYKDMIQNIIDNYKSVDLKFAKVSYFLINIDGLGHINYAYEDEELSYDKDEMSQSVYNSYVGTYKIGAKADEGWKFVKWTKDGKDYSADPEITITLDEENFELVAVFEPDGLEEIEVNNYVEEESSTNPETGDNIITIATIFAIAMLGAFTITRLIK